MLDALCTTAQTVVCGSARIAISRDKTGLRREPYVFIVCVVIALVAVVGIPRMRAAGGVNAAPLGWMSEQWLAEHRASHPR